MWLRQAQPPEKISSAISTSSATEKDKLSHLDKLSHRKRQAQPSRQAQPPEKTSSATTPHKIKEVCAALQSVFHVQVEDMYLIFIDLANRKTALMKFIPKLEEVFLRKVDEADAMR